MHNDIVYDILRFLQEEALIRFPAFPEAFGQLKPKEDSELEAPLGTDGIHLFYHPILLRQCFLENVMRLRLCYLQVHLHCLCLHVVQNAPAKAAYWDMACDLSAALLSGILYENEALKNVRLKLTDLLTSEAVLVLNTPTVSALDAEAASALDTEVMSAVDDRAPSAASASENATKKCLCSDALTQLRAGSWLSPAALLSLFEQCPNIIGLAKSCALDSHRHWFRSLYPSEPYEKNTANNSACSGNGPSKSHLSPAQLTHLEKLRMNWKDKMPSFQTAATFGRKNGYGGGTAEEAELQQKDGMDYRRFLRQFTVPREEALIDMDSFDYIPYYYGLEYYSKEINAGEFHVPFIEPLEYREVNRLDELAIAIDTSGSCSGKIVRRFLEETWSILRQRENFFARMRIHLIQCDSMIQEHRIFTSVEEWEDSLKDLRILGQGNTDFRPVFEHLEKLIQKKEIRHLRGLLYFTDGDGIFPAAPPQWSTAFVFLNRQTEKHSIPDWAIRLNLHLPDEF